MVAIFRVSRNIAITFLSALIRKLLTLLAILPVASAGTLSAKQCIEAAVR